MILPSCLHFLSRWVYRHAPPLRPMQLSILIVNSLIKNFTFFSKEGFRQVTKVVIAWKVILLHGLDFPCEYTVMTHCFPHEHSKFL
jgi:hypothetical protein